MLAPLGLALPLAQAETIVGIGGLCLDIKGGAGQGKSVIVWKCNGQMNEIWHLDGKSAEACSADGYC